MYCTITNKMFSFKFSFCKKCRLDVIMFRVRRIEKIDIWLYWIWRSFLYQRGTSYNDACAVSHVAAFKVIIFAQCDKLLICQPHLYLGLIKITYSFRILVKSIKFHKQLSKCIERFFNSFCNTPTRQG